MTAAAVFWLSLCVTLGLSSAASELGSIAEAIREHTEWLKTQHRLNAERPPFEGVWP